MPPASPPTPLPSGTLVTVTESAIDLGGLPPQTTFAARVTAVGPDGLIRLETALGRVVATASTLALEPGASLRLQIDSGGNVRLQPALGQAGAAPTLQASPAAPGGGAIATLVAGDVVPAQLLPAQAAGPSTPVATQSSPVTILVRVLAVEAAAPGPAPVVLAGATPGQAAALLSEDQPDTLPPVQLTAGGPIQAAVTGRGALGQPVLNFVNGALLLETGDLPDGAMVRLEVLATAGSAASAPSVIAPLTQLIDEMMAALAMAQPALAAAFESSRIPRMGQKLTSPILFLMSVLQGGSVRGWLGQDAHQAMQQDGRDGLLKRLSQALSQRAPRVESDPTQLAGELWRSVYLPVATPHGWQPLRVAWRDPEPAEDDGDEEDRSRFQIDFSFSRLGPIRIDGLAGTGRLDLLLISRARLMPAERSELEELFVMATETLGLNGHIRFVEQPELAAPEVHVEQPHASVTA